MHLCQGYRFFVNQCMGVQGCSGKVRMSQNFLYGSDINAVGIQNAGAAVPLRYNYDKPEKPRISRVFGYKARFFILFQPEKTSREVVMKCPLSSRQ